MRDETRHTSMLTNDACDSTTESQKRGFDEHTATLPGHMESCLQVVRCATQGDFRKDDVCA